tara:strand:+ start:1546 stop:1770 length:225 start_codon:yes stop_codon:yes gene_type:complete
MKKDSNPNDWKKNPKSGFLYKSTTDPKYIRDRNKLFKENGNGWWWYHGTNLAKYTSNYSLLMEKLLGEKKENGS